MTESILTQSQKHFIQSSAYKRSRRYFDIMRLNQIEHQQQVSRRMPTSKDTIQTRLGDSFVSSNDLLQSKVEKDISYFHKKPQTDSDELETAHTARRQSKQNTVDMRKMLARNDLERSARTYRNQQQFNNYYVSPIKPRMSLDFQKHIGRKSESLDSPQSPEENARNNVGKVYQKLVFDQSNFSCFVDYKNNRKEPPKEIIENSPRYELSKIRRGEYLTKKNTFAKQLQFYPGNGRYDPCSLDNKVLKDNEYFWKGVKEERDRLKDFSVSKRQQDEKRKRIQQVLARKKSIDFREQMCDEKYFKRLH